MYQIIQVFQAVKTSKCGNNPVYVSIGNKCCLKTAVDIVVKCSDFRIPEPIRQVNRNMQFTKYFNCFYLNLLVFFVKHLKYWFNELICKVSFSLNLNWNFKLRHLVKNLLISWGQFLIGWLEVPWCPEKKQKPSMNIDKVNKHRRRYQGFLTTLRIYQC